ncbi:MAG TPA: hypothetical protein VK335_33635 [Bryobacteraceae bacterium]|nr:hypothetical protein [Bryobacteraceae bacterium]
MLGRILLVALLTVGISSAADALAAGKYAGKWEGSSASGEFRMMLTSAPEGKWSADIVFTLDGQAVKCTVKSLTVAGSKLKAVYAFDLQGYDLESTIEGELSADKLGGKYTTRTGDGTLVDEGTWQTTATS